ncbi:MAG: S-methyl-5-thioribose-1-phosphate isomerase [Ruminococcus sp.]|nr:S-methyl-5-thioribose-1-phosphate isomerase [Ruminococcus sp.]
MKNLLPDTVSYDEEKNELVIVDQTKLPSAVEMLRLSTINDIYLAIKSLAVRGAPAIGVAAAYAVYIAALSIDTDDTAVFAADLKKAEDFINSARPTAVNLSWAIGEMDKIVSISSGLTVSRIKALLYRRAKEIKDNEIISSVAIGKYGLELLPKDGTILTVCNAGHFATVRWGTATAPIYIGKQNGINFKVYSLETRPLLQGLRITAFELQKSGVDVTAVCDNMAATLLKSGKISAVITGADRIAANGDVCNKIGTLMLAICAKRYGVPFYAAAPSSTVDLSIESGEKIYIEERDGSEITELWFKKRLAPDGVKVFNPAFDVTENDLVTAIITDKGIVKPPFTENLKKTLKNTLIV